MKIKGLTIAMLVGVGLLLGGCSCATWTSFWGGDPDKECTSHWEFKEKEVAEPVKEVARGPCAAPVTSKVVQSYPVTGVMGSAIRLEKMAPEEVVAGQEFDYRIKVTNLTNQELNNVIVKDRIPESLQFKSSAPEMVKLATGEIQWSLGSLGAKASEMISVEAVAMGKGSLTSCADVSYDRPICAQIDIVEPRLQLAKTVPSEVLMCDRIPVEYVITNTGTGYACDVIIEDILQPGLVTAEGSSKLSFSLASLAPGQSKKFTAMMDANKSGSYGSRAVAKSSNSGTIESNLASTKVSQPVLAISETGPATRFIGRSMGYEITVTNRGDGIAKNAVIEATVPEGAKFESASVGGRFTHFSPGKVVWSVGTLEPNVSKKVEMVLMAEKTGNIVTEAMAKAYCAETVSTSAQTSLSGIPAILLEVIDIEDPIEIGQSGTYVIAVTNQGSAEGTNIRISCTLEAGMEYVSSSGPTSASVVGNTITFSPLSSLAPKAQTRWQVNIRALSAGDTRFRVTMNSDQLIRSVEESEATRLYE